MTSDPKDNFLRPTNIFAIVGIFIPGFTACGILGLQMLLVLFGIECASAWKILWFFTTVASLLVPAIFFRYIIKTNDDIKRIKKWLTVFNIFEYTFIQATLGMLFSDGKRLCYVTDGQNGIQFIFTAWVAIPVLICLSYLFQAVLKKRNKFSAIAQ
jgi:hypothetical protein